MRDISDRQRKLLVLSAEGKTTGQMVNTLHFCKETIKRDFRYMFEEFGVPNRVALVAQAIREGVID